MEWISHCGFVLLLFPSYVYVGQQNNKEEISSGEGKAGVDMYLTYFI
jgi:hypothetical protein